MSAMVPQQEFITLFEFIVLKGNCFDCNLLNDPLCESILLKRKETFTYSEKLLASILAGKFPVKFDSFKQAPICQKLINFLPINCLEMLFTEYDLFYKTRSSVLVGLSIQNKSTSCNKDLVTNKKVEIKSCDLLTGQDNKTTGSVGGKLQKLARLKDSKQIIYLWKLLDLNTSNISEQDTSVLIRVFTDLARKLRKLNPSVLLPAKCRVDVENFNSTNLNDLCKACVVDSADICKFISSIIITSVPLSSVFGTCKFRRIFIRSLLKLIRGSELYDSNFLAKLPFKELGNCTLTTFADKPDVIFRVHYSVIKDMILPLLKNHFYITKYGKNFVFHYKPLWLKLQDLGFKQLLSYFTEVEEEYVDFLQLSGQLFGIYTLRIQPKPKGNGIRLISLVNKTAPCGIAVDKPVNANLIPVHAVLKSVWSDMNMARCFKPRPIKGKSDLVKKIESYKAGLSNRVGGELFYYKCDAKSCYDNINLEVLQTEVLDSLFWTSSYHVLKIRVKCHLTHRSYTKNIAIPCTEMEKLSFQEIMMALEKSLRHCTIVLIKHKVYARDKIKRFIGCFLKDSFVHHQGKFYQRKTGLPQGAKISKLLCDFYFNYIFREVSVSSESLFISATDDFLFLSSNKSEVDKFMHDVSSNVYDFVLNGDKTESYLDNKKEIIYFGVKIKR